MHLAVVGALLLSSLHEARHSTTTTYAELTSGTDLDKPCVRYFFCYAVTPLFRQPKRRPSHSLLLNYLFIARVGASLYEAQMVWKIVERQI